MIFWDFLVLFNFLIASIGILANLVFFKLVVLSPNFDVYHRAASFIIVSGHFLLIIANVTSVTMCLMHGSYFDSGPCSETKAHHFFLYVHAYGGFSMSDGIFLLVFERYASVFYPTFRSSKVYKFWFIALICAHIFGLVSYLYLMVTVRTTVSAMTAMSSLTILYVITFILVAVLLCLSKKRYYETGVSVTGEKLSESYELCRSTLPAIIVSSLLNIGYCITTWLLALGYLFQDVFYEYFAFGNVVITLNATLFPILFLYGNKKIRRKILKLSPFYVNSVVAHNGVQKLDGHSIELFQTQNEYFDQLRSSWS